MEGYLVMLFKDTKLVYYRFDFCCAHLDEHHSSILLCLKWCIIIPSVPVPTNKLLIRWCDHANEATLLDFDGFYAGDCGEAFEI